MKYKGYVTSYPIGVKNDMMQLVIWEDDGTWGKHITFKLNDIPIGTIPIIDIDGLWKLARLLNDAYGYLKKEEKK